MSNISTPKNILARTRVVNRRKGIPLWEPLMKAGVASTVLRCPCTFPPETLHGRMLAGVGVPDLRGSQSKGTFYTQDKMAIAQENEQLVVLNSGPEFTTGVIGPRNTKLSAAADTFCEIRVQMDKTARKLTIHTGG